MTDLDHLVDWGFKLLAFVATLIFIPIFRAIRKLELENVERKGDIKRADDKIIHIESNYKQGIAYLSDKIDDINASVSEMNTDIKDLLKMTAKRKDD